MNAGRMLRTARRRRAMTQRDLAVASGVPQSSIARIEQGVTVPRIDTLHRLLRAAGHDLELGPTVGDGVDRTQIRALMALTSADRGRAAELAGRNLLQLLRRARTVDRSPRT
jgi:transcriptional regulator with XRE-family HTH domain